MKHLIVCCDGTWNTPDQEDDGLPAPTNVVRLHRCVSEATAAGVDQRTYYHPGVGTEGGVLGRLTGGMYGRGISQNIQSAYHWLARNYAKGDKIFLFGFSRGAYTVRSLAGMIGRCGLLSLTKSIDAREGWKRVSEIYEGGYRHKQGKAWSPPASWKFRIPKKRADAVHFLGVWDTVGALGVPNDLALLNFFDRPRNWMFHDTELGTGVTTARHAVALDEMRASFTPTMWTNKHADMKQVWFPGVHSDVGGGYAQTGLADGALRWMIDEAAAAGLDFKSVMVSQIQPNYQGLLFYVPNHDPPRR
jgi:uncharacterized protein (DUF2235 family)